MISQKKEGCKALPFLLFLSHQGSQVYPHLPQRLTVLFAPMKSQNQFTPLAPVVIEVEVFNFITYI